MSLKFGKKSNDEIKNGLFTLFAQVSKLGFQFTSLIIISRFLIPSQVGAFSLAAVIIGGFEVIRDFGFRNSIIQAETMSDNELNRIFWQSVLWSGLLFVFVLTSSMALSTYFTESNFLHFLSILSICLLISGIQATSSVTMAKKEKFYGLNSTDFIAQFIGGFAGILLALHDFGTTSLVVQYILATISLAIMRYILSDWKPKSPEIKLMPRNFYVKSSHLFASKFAIWTSNNTDNFIISARYAVTDIGVYMRSFSLSMVPQQSLLESFENWALPTLKNRFNNSTDKYRNINKVQIFLTFFFLPVNLILFTYSTFLVDFLLGEEWARVAPLLQLFAISGLFNLYNQLFRWTYILFDETLILRNVTLASRAITIISVLLASTISLEAIAFSYTISGAVSWISFILFASAKMKRSMMKYLKIQIASLSTFFLFIFVIGLK
jgi:O-antigen/teichoic acid export membrane protein